ncbi:MAG: type II toxin-antitoxin system RelE/ParE family toxin [Thermoanaerobaculia bacterium]
MSEWDDRARRELRALDPPIQQGILRFTGGRLATTEDPRQFGKALGGNLGGFWRYRVGDYRLICALEDDRLVVLIVGVGHRSTVYR